MDLLKEFQKLQDKINKELKISDISIKILSSKENNKGRLIIMKNKQIDKQFDIELISICQIHIIENDKMLEEGLFIDDLGQWIFNLYNPIEYLYAFYGGDLNKKILTRNEVDKLSSSLTQDYHKEREQGLIVHRQELDNQPIVEGYLGPMFDKIDYGKIYLRYETQKIYDMLSD